MGRLRTVWKHRWNGLRWKSEFRKYAPFSPGTSTWHPIQFLSLKKAALRTSTGIAQRKSSVPNLVSVDRTSGRVLANVATEPAWALVRNEQGHTVGPQPHTEA